MANKRRRKRKLKPFTKILMVLIPCFVVVGVIYGIDINKTNDNNYCAVFSGQEVNLSDEKFDGANLTSVFGGIDLDLRNAKINSDTVIDVKCVFGGADILVPDNVKVKISSSSFFGGVDNKKKNKDDQNKKYTLYIKATCVLGGVDIK